MENSIIVALSRQETLQRKMDVVANNLANMNTTAYKAERMMFTDYLARSTLPRQGLGSTTEFVRDGGTARDLAEGGFADTGNDLDVAISGSGYFAVDTTMGPRYTRDGHFRLDETGRIVTGDGLPVLGTGNAPITVNPGDTQITIARDGTVSSETAQLGQLRVVSFQNEQAMQTVEGGLLQSDETPADVRVPVLMQGMLERSNVQPIAEIDELIDVQRSYEQATSLIEREDDRIRKMLQAYAA